MKKFILFLQKGVYPYRYMDSRKNSMKHHYLKRKVVTITSTWKIMMIHITHTKIRICEDYETKNLGEHHDFCFQSNTLLTADAFENFQNMCGNIRT